VPNRASRLALTVAAFLAAMGLHTFASGVGGAPGVGWIPAASAQTTADLAAARKLFAEALADEAAGRDGVALEKFQRVQAVRDTQAVRYRIATCFEAMGKLRAALDAYTAASVAAGTDAESASVARSARDKLASLSKRVGRIVVNLPPKAPDDAVVKIDGELVQSNAIGTPVVVDPGAHEVTAVATGMQAFHAPATTGEGGTATVDVAFVSIISAIPTVPTDAPPLNAPLAPPPPPPPPVRSESVPPPPDEPPSRSRASRTAGVVLVTAGAVLAAGAVVLVVVRAEDIASLKDACPGGLCPPSRQSELESTRSRALVEGPAAIAVGATGVVAAGIGVVLLATSGDGRARPAAAGIAPWFAHDAGGIAWSARF
jgi:hypothetical protein